MKPQYAKDGTLDFWFVMPSKSLRVLVYNHLKKQYPQLNYCCEWLDAKGYGLHLGIASWNNGTMYHVPN